MKPHDGIATPLELGPVDRVRVKQRDGFVDIGEAREFGWTHRLDREGKPWAGDIVAYEAAP